MRLFVALEEDLLDWPLAVLVCSREKTFKLLLLLLNTAKVVAKVEAALPSAETELATCELVLIISESWVCLDALIQLASVVEHVIVGVEHLLVVIVLLVVVIPGGDEVTFEIINFS